LLRILKAWCVNDWTLVPMRWVWWCGGDLLKQVEPLVAPRRVEALAEVLGHAGGNVARETIAVLGLNFVDEDDELFVDSKELLWKGGRGKGLAWYASRKRGAAAPVDIMGLMRLANSENISEGPEISSGE